MRRKKRFLFYILAIIIIIVILVLVWGSDVTNLNKIKTTDIKEITISNPVKGYTINDQQDIQLLFNTLQSMKLSKKLMNNKDGFAFLVDIKLNSGDVISMSILSSDVKIGNSNYKPDKDYCNDIRIIFDTLGKK